MRGLPYSSDGKESVCNAGDPGLIPGVRKIPWRREWQPTPVLLPGESHGQRSLAGYSPRGRKESDTTEGLTLTATVKDSLPLRQVWKDTSLKILYPAVSLYVPILTLENRNKVLKIKCQKSLEQSVGPEFISPPQGGNCSTRSRPIASLVLHPTPDIPSEWSPMRRLFKHN